MLARSKMKATLCQRIVLLLFVPIQLAIPLLVAVAEENPHALINGRRQIAEFECTERIVVRYPFDIPMEALAEITNDTKLTTIVEDDEEQEAALRLYRRHGLKIANCDFLHARTDSYWTRDYLPWLVAAQGAILAVDFQYNRERPLDNAVSSAFAKHLDIRLEHMPLVHTGGNILTDGRGKGFSTKLVLEENPLVSSEQIEATVRRVLGITEYHTLPDPNRTPIDHINCWAKLLGVDKILLRSVPETDPEYIALEGLADYLSRIPSSYGTPYRVFRVFSPSSEPYTNAIIVNDKVLVPLGGTSWDNPALKVYREAMPGYRIFGINGHWLPTDGLACRTFGVPDRELLSIQHFPLSGALNAMEAGFPVTANILSHGGHAVAENGATLHYASDGTSFRSIVLASHRHGVFHGTIPLHPSGTVISYYVQATDVSGRTERHPFIGRHDPHVFRVE